MFVDITQLSPRSGAGVGPPHPGGLHRPAVPDVRAARAEPRGGGGRAPLGHRHPRVHLPAQTQGRRLPPHRGEEGESRLRPRRADLGGKCPRQVPRNIKVMWKVSKVLTCQSNAEKCFYRNLPFTASKQKSPIMLGLPGLGKIDSEDKRTLVSGLHQCLDNSAFDYSREGSIGMFILFMLFFRY